MIKDDPQVTVSFGRGEEYTLTSGQLSEVAEKIKERGLCGHNSLPGGGAEALKSYIERIERLEEEKANLAVDIREVFAEAKANGYDTKTMRKVIALRKLDAAEREEADALLELYQQALGMLPLFAAAENEEEPS